MTVSGSQAGAAAAEQLMRQVRQGLGQSGAYTGTAAGSALAGFEHWRAAEERLPAKREYALHELLRFADRDFVENAYWVVLLRAPDEAGLGNNLDALRSGRASKIEVLAGLRWSEEGRMRGVHIDGLLLPSLLHKWRRRRLIGPVIGWLHSVVRLAHLAEREERAEAMHAREAQELGLLLNRVVSQVGQQFAQVHATLEHQAALQTELVELRHRAAQVEAGLAAIPEAFAVLRQTLASLQDHVSALGQSVNTLHRDMGSVHEALPRLERDIASSGTQLTELTQALPRIGSKLAALQDLVAPLREEFDRKLLDAERARSLDALYVAFEDRFRGLPELIRARLTPHLKWIREAGVGGPADPVIDLGFGRGEWLDLLRHEAFVARGIDTNREFLAAARSAGLDVMESDALEGLSGMADASVGAVTAMHLAEHLPFEQLVTLLDQALRVLRHDGLLVLETPNPENAQVASHWFYLDPTHRNPLPPEMLAWLVEARGFTGVRIERLTTARDFGAPDLLPAEDPRAATLNAVLAHYRAAPDYAIVARRP